MTNICFKVDKTDGTEKETKILYKDAEAINSFCISKVNSLYLYWTILSVLAELLFREHSLCAGHCQRATNEIISSLIRWKPYANGRRAAN